MPGEKDFYIGDFNSEDCMNFHYAIPKMMVHIGSIPLFSSSIIQNRVRAPLIRNNFIGRTFNNLVGFNLVSQSKNEDDVNFFYSFLFLALRFK
jgi:hypothetical protein